MESYDLHSRDLELRVEFLLTEEYHYCGGTQWRMSTAPLCIASLLMY
jgi:hypothetical protein